jgi:hypothetical protein
VTAEDAAADAHLREILASDEFKSPFADRFWQRFIDFLDAVFHILTGLGPLAKVGVALVAAALLTGLFAVAWRTFGRALSGSPRARPSVGAAPRPAALTAADLAEQARALAAASRWRDAARALHQALLLRLCAQAGIQWRTNVSDWEWLARLPPSQPLTEFTRRAERLAFGTMPDATEFDRCVRLYEELVGHAR